MNVKPRRSYPDESRAERAPRIDLAPFNQHIPKACYLNALDTMYGNDHDDDTPPPSVDSRDPTVGTSDSLTMDSKERKLTSSTDQDLRKSVSRLEQVLGQGARMSISVEQLLLEVRDKLEANTRADLKTTSRLEIRLHALEDKQSQDSQELQRGVRELQQGQSQQVITTTRRSQGSRYLATCIYV